MAGLAIIAGRSNEGLSRSIAARLNLELTPVIIDCYSSGESRVEILHSVRNQVVFIVQSGYTYEEGSPSPNDYIMETIMLADACFHASAQSIYLLMPCLPYCNSAEENGFGEPIDIESIECGNDLEKWLKESLFNIVPEKVDDPALYEQLKKHHESVPKPIFHPIAPMVQTDPLKLVAKLLTCSGISKLLTFALPRPQLVGYFDIPVDDLSVAPVLSCFLRTKGSTKRSTKNYTVATSDLELAKSASHIAKALNFPFTFSSKLPGQDEFYFSGENLEGKDILLVDGIGKQAFEAAEAFKQKSCSSVSLLVVHLLLDSPSSDISYFKDNSNVFDEIFITNSNRIPEEILKCTNVQVVDLAEYFAEAIKCIVNGDSLKELQNNLLK